MNKQGIKKTSWKVGSIILFNLLLLTIFSCARMGSPDGGWYDETPPKILGTSPATSDQAEEMLAYIRSIVAEKYGKDAASETSILYGGSCKASNAPELFSKPNIDGGLIGGASLKAADFKGIIDAWKK